MQLLVLQWDSTGRLVSKYQQLMESLMDMKSLIELFLASVSVLNLKWEIASYMEQKLEMESFSQF